MGQWDKKNIFFLIIHERKKNAVALQVVFDLKPHLGSECGHKVNHHITGLTFMTIFTVIIKQITWLQNLSLASPTEFVSQNSSVYHKL